MDFITSFPSGASGRFINSIVTCLVYDLSPVMTYQTTNAAHDWSHESSYAYTASPEVDDLLESSVYQSLQFTGEWKHHFFWTHAYPDFEQIHHRLPDTKIILITFDDDSMAEIDANSYYKNALPKRHYWVDPRFKHDNVIVPENIKHNVLLIRYADIFDTNMLDTLAKFTNTIPNEATKQNFQNYVDGQRKFAVDVKTKK
jgi:hypothetical protein